MASTDLRTYIENRLTAIDPSMDISAGSPAQTEFIDPLLSYLGTDPFETDIDTFILDRFRQEYPDIYAGDPSAVRDLFIKPLITLLEPFKREIQAIKRSKSFADPELLSDDDADAIGANWFSTRAGGGYSKGVVRVYYATPTNVPVDISTKFATSSGLSFFPSQPSTMTAEQMVFNRSGAQYYMDVPVRAESPGAEYNVPAGAITAVTGLYGVVRVSNLRATTDGTNKLSTEDFIAKSQAMLSERSLVTSRGGTARVNELFQNEVAALQVIGAGDEEMQRDLLVGTSTGHAWLTGKVSLYENLGLVQARTVDDSVESSPSPGDTLYAYFPSLPQAQRFVRLTIEEIIGPKLGAGGEFQCSWLVRWSGVLPAGAVLPAVVEGGCLRQTGITIGSLPTTGDVNLDLKSGEAHVLGHTDYYVRPVLQEVSTTALSEIVDSAALIERATLETTATPNILVDPIAKTGPTITDAFDFLAAGVRPGDVLSIDSGDASGTYVIGKVTGNIPGAPMTPSRIYVTADLTKTGSGWRYRISRSATVDIFEPKHPKLPFSGQAASDLQIAIGSNIFTFTKDILDFGAKVGDTVRVLEGQDAGDFVIVGFTDGQHALVDRNAATSGSNLSYEIFTLLEPVERPLVRLKEISLLDSSGKATGVTVPPALPVAVVPTSDFTTAKVLGQSFVKSGFVLPSITGLLATNVAATLFAGNDQRYSLGMEDTEGGVYKAMEFEDGAQSEMLFPADMADCSWFLCTVEDRLGATGVPPTEEPHVGDSLYIKSGPNKGGYIVKRVRKFKYTTGAPADHTFWIFFVQIHGVFPFDTFKSLIEFFDTHGAPVTKLTGAGATLFPSFFTDFWDGLGASLRTSLLSIGVPAPSAADLLLAVQDSVACDYEVGTPARGTLRSYFIQPTLFQQNTFDSEAATVYEFETAGGDIVRFRPDPALYEEHTLLPAREEGDPSFGDLPRDASVSGVSVTLGMEDKPSAFEMGVQVGDYVDVHEEVLVTTAGRLLAVQTSQNSNLVEAPTGSPFSSDMVGNYLSLEEGDDEGIFRITGVPAPNKLLLDRAMSGSTPSVLLRGEGALIFFTSSQDRLTCATVDFTTYVGLVGKYLSVYDVQADGTAYWQGSWPIATVLDAHSVVLTRTGYANFPGVPVGARFVVTDAPTSTPKAAGLAGTELHGVRPIRMYQDRPFSTTITAVSDSPTTSVLTLAGAPAAGSNLPYRIYRKNIRRITPLEMALHREGAFFYFDTNVLSLTPRPEANLSKESYLVPLEGTFDSYGYRHAVGDPSLTYSTRETGEVVFPLRVLPEGMADRRDNELNVIGSSVQITYERADIVARIQEYLDSREDRTTTANMLARHFLPAYVSYDASYVGGSDMAVVAKDIIDYVNNIPIDTPLDVSELQDKIRLRGGNPETPTTVALVIHDWDRRMWVEFGQNKLGGYITKVPYHGTPRVSYYVPGKDLSDADSIPYGERIMLSRV